MVSSAESHRCSSWHLKQVVVGQFRVFSGIWGAAEGQTGPQSLDESFLCGTQSIVCAGKGHGDGNTAQSWTLSSDSSFLCKCLCVCVCERERESRSVGERKRKCVLTHDMQREGCSVGVCESLSEKVREQLEGRHHSGPIFISLYGLIILRAQCAKRPSKSLFAELVGKLR